ncbi:hypothetical protein BKA70DRAFT_1311642 [Coprinopsis sp. MPI-PUGE-AT-0042]|nr:hypothetical protein BKA70DRAFT_1311642 [Coprinopsis sp. MPI-PUGE-AT-0042]
MRGEVNFVLEIAGQTGTLSVARSVSMVNVDTTGYTTGYRDSLLKAFDSIDPIEGLYTGDDSSTRLRSRTGLRHEYRFGLINYRGFSRTSDEIQGSCGKKGLTEPHFQPYFAINADMPLNYS